MNTDEIWQQTKADLSHSMPNATYDKHLATATATADGAVWTIAVGSDGSAEVLNNQDIGKTVSSALAGVVGRPVNVEFVVKKEGPGPGEFAVSISHFDPLRKGFVQAPNYVVQFWQPYLTPLPFALWIAIRSFWRGTNDPYPAIQTLADIVAKGNRHKILGRNARAGRKPVMGALEILEEEQIVTVKRIGEGRERSYQFLLIDFLPLLTPAQVFDKDKGLPDNLIENHRRFLESCSIDYAIWLEIQNSTLIGVNALMSRT